MLKQVFSPAHNRHVSFGRKRPTSRPAMNLKHYLRELPPVTVPAAENYGVAAGVPNILADIMCNDTLGCCVIAGINHVLGVVTGNAGKPFKTSDAQIIKEYSAIGGYVPGDPSTDQGCEIPVALKYLRTKGFADGTKSVGDVAIDVADPDEVRAAIYLFENALGGFELPDAWVASMPTGNGFIWQSAGAPDPQNGHCVPFYAYDHDGPQFDSWGLLGTMTWSALKKYGAAKANGEFHAILTPDQIAKGKAKAPNGLDWAALEADFADLGGVLPKAS